MGTGILKLNRMERRDGHRYCGAYYDRDTRWAQVFQSLMGWKQEMSTDIVEIIGMETRDLHSTVEFICDGDTRWAQILWS